MPFGGFSPLQSDVLESVAKRLGATPTAVAQSWLLQHSPNIMLIPGTSSVAHLRENIAGAALTLPADAVVELDAIRWPGWRVSGWRHGASRGR
jgi:pyridoxine 4-dehydrogenase